MRRAPTILIATALALAGCGGAHKTVHKTPAHPQIVVGHPCDPANYYMQCALQAQPKQGLSAPRASTIYARGIDFAWSCPSPAGVDFGASYFSPDSSKNWSLACVGIYKAAGKARVGVYESSATRAAQGFNAGFSDAFNGRHQARLRGWPDNRPLDYAIDFDASGPQVASYFQGANAGDLSVTHIRGEVDAYGGAYPLNWLCAHGLVGHSNWVTYAWLYRTGGVWPAASCAPLQQWLNSSAVDYDRAIAPDYGQVPAPAPPAPVDPHRYLWFPTGKGTPDERGTVESYDGARAQPVKYRTYLLTLEGRLHTLAHSVWVAAHKDCCNGSFNLPATWGVFHRGWRYQQLSKRAHGEQIKGFR